MNFKTIETRILELKKTAVELNLKELNEFKLANAKEIYSQKTILNFVDIVKKDLPYEEFVKAINELFYKDPSVLTTPDSTYVVFEVINLLNTSSFVNCQDDTILIKLKYTLLQAFAESFKHLAEDDLQIIYNELLSYAFCAIPKRQDFCLLDLYDTLMTKFYNDPDYNIFTKKVLSQLLKQNKKQVAVEKYLLNLKARF